MFSAYSSATSLQPFARCLRAQWPPPSSRAAVFKSLVCFVFGRRERRGDFEIADAGQFGQDLILNAVSEISVGFLLAQVLERQYSDRFSGVLALGPELA